MRLLYALVLYASLSASAYAGQVAYTVHSTDIKQKPFSDATTVATLKEKTSVNILSRQGGWVNITSTSGKGWVRMLSLRSDSTDQKSGDTGLHSLLNVGRSGSSGVTVATGVRGLSEEDIKNANPKPQELEKLKNYVASKTQAEQFAQEVKLEPQQLDYLPAGGKP